MLNNILSLLRVALCDECQELEDGFCHRKYIKYILPAFSAADAVTKTDTGLKIGDFYQLKYYVFEKEVTLLYLLLNISYIYYRVFLISSAGRKSQKRNGSQARGRYTEGGRRGRCRTDCGG